MVDGAKTPKSAAKINIRFRPHPISGNSQWGGYITDSGTTGNLVEGNFIGTDGSGNAPLPNGYNGLDITSGAQSNTVGGTTAAARNIISGNANNGVVIAFSGASYNT